MLSINQTWQARGTFVYANSNGLLCYPFTVSINKCVGSYNCIYNSYVQICAPNKVKNKNVKAFSLMSEVNEIRFLISNESYNRITVSIDYMKRM